MIVSNLQNYYYYQELASTGYQEIHTEDINENNIEDHFKGIINIMADGLEQEAVQRMKLHVVFPDDTIDLYIIQYMYNLMFWTLIVEAHQPILSTHLFFEDPINKSGIKKYIDKFFVRKNIKTIPIIRKNQIIDDCIGKFRALIRFQMFLCNTVNLKDTIDFMNKYPEFNDTMHLDVTNIPMEDMKEYGMKATKKQAEYITSSNDDHALKYSLMSGEGTNLKQYKEVIVNI